MIDRYTKIVLTVIATALVTLAVQNAIRQSDAQSFGPQKVQICDLLDHCADLTEHTTSVGGGIDSNGTIRLGTEISSYSLDVTPAQQ